ncbi:protein YjiJ [Enterobacter cancerogenus]|uniref:Protein YjiJ n=1 Tax=Enterobacter cancerogenus TaxID=69218 RepID=A0A484YGX0_9ENTR|nr:protein YjiJ [Enterobacter cancerogenus]
MALRIALSGFVVLVVAMGIGRFAFTPQVPADDCRRATHADQRGAGGGDELPGLSGRGLGMPCAPIASWKRVSGWV